MKLETIEDYKINYKKHIFSKSIKITLRGEKSILVTMPLYCPYKTARNFLINNFEKIKSFKFNTPSLSDEELKILRKRAKNYLPERTKYLADKYGFQIGRIALRNQKTRFGSCSYRNNINLNIKLMNYDFDVIDYVIIHELVHTKIKNHSKDFWLEVEKYCPNYKELRKKLITF
ncbi:M48 family metallopeptidase [bacterium]|nr:M48 family metallopeptidase [bacterium]